MNDREMFHQVMIGCRLGGRLATETFPPEAAELYAHERSRAVAFIDSARSVLPKLPPIYFDFATNPAINAVAAVSEDGRYFIGLSRGTISALNFLFFRMLADPRILEHIGDAKGEDEKIATFPGLAPDAQRMKNAGAVLVFPRDPKRSQYASRLRGLALDFLVGHEISHIANGHLDYHNQKYQLSFLAELGYSSGEAESPLTRQTMEWDADSCTVSNALSNIKNKSSNSASWCEELLYPWSISMLSLFQLFGNESFAGVDLSSIPYPPIALRSWMATLTAETYIREKWDPDLVNDAAYILAVTGGEVLRAFSIITGKPPVGKGLLDAMGPTGKEHMDRLSEHWKTRLKGELQRYAYTNLPD